MWLRLGSYRCSQVLVEVCWGRPIYLGGKLCATWSGIDTLLAYSTHELPTDTCTTRQSGMTCLVLTGAHGGGTSMLSRQVSPASHSALPESSEQATTRAMDGQPLPASFARYDRATCTWRTCQASFLESMGTTDEYSESWPRSGMMLDGVCYPLQRLGRRTNETGYGYMATPTSTANQLSPSMRKHPGCVAWLPTPTAHNAKETAAPSEWKRNTPTLATRAGGTLNPTWVEWLMGWPLGWTDLEPLGTDRFRWWLQQHGVR